MSRSHGRATGQHFPDFAQNLEIFMRKLRKYALTPLFYSLFFMIHTYYVMFGVIFAFFLGQKLKKKVLTAQKKSSFRMSVFKLD